MSGGGLGLLLGFPVLEKPKLRLKLMEFLMMMLLAPVGSTFLLGGAAAGNMRGSQTTNADLLRGSVNFIPNISPFAKIFTFPGHVSFRGVKWAIFRVGTFDFSLPFVTLLICSVSPLALTSGLRLVGLDGDAGGVGLNLGLPVLSVFAAAALAVAVGLLGGVRVAQLVVIRVGRHDVYFYLDPLQVFLDWVSITRTVTITLGAGIHAPIEGSSLIEFPHH